MQLLQAIDTRSSALRLTGPGPDRADLERILTAGVRAPDHGRLAPWRFRVLRGDARHVLGEALAGFTQRTKPDATADQIEAARAKALRAPATRKHPKMADEGNVITDLQLDQPAPRGVFIGLQGGHVQMVNLDEFTRLVDMEHQRRKEQWWMELRPIAAELSRPTQRAN